METSLTAEQLLQNYKKLNDFITEYFNNTGNEYWIRKAQQLIDLHEELADRLIIAPAASNPALHSAYPGGYVVHTLNVIKAAMITFQIWKKMGINLTDEDKHELIFCAAVHDLGKVGNMNEDHYIPETSEWHIKNRLQYYKKNENIPWMKIQDRTLWMLQTHGIILSENEYITILVHDGLYEESNKQYYMQYDAPFKFKTAIPYILHHADIMSTRLEFENWYIPYLEEQAKQNSKETMENEIKAAPKKTFDDDVRRKNLVTDFSTLFGKND